MLIYATIDDLQEWLPDGEPPDNAATLIRYASLLIADATSSAFYPVDVTGMPTDAPTLQALTDATCAQAVFWSAAKIDPSASSAGIAGPASSKKVGTAALTYNTTPAQTQARMDAAETLCAAAQRVLQLAGLLGTTVWSYG